MSFYIYQHRNINNEIIYIGRTVNMETRQKSHLSKAGHKDEISEIYYAEVSNKTLMDIYELYYINKIDPVFNMANARKDEVEELNLPELHFQKYVKKDNTINKKRSVEAIKEEKKLKKEMDSIKRNREFYKSLRKRTSLFIEMLNEKTFYVIDNKLTILLSYDDFKEHLYFYNFCFNVLTENGGWNFFNSNYSLLKRADFGIAELDIISGFEQTNFSILNESDNRKHFDRHIAILKKVINKKKVTNEKNIKKIIKKIEVGKEKSKPTKKEIKEREEETEKWMCLHIHNLMKDLFYDRDAINNDQQIKQSDVVLDLLKIDHRYIDFINDPSEEMLNIVSSEEEVGISKWIIRRDKCLNVKQCA